MRLPRVHVAAVMMMAAVAALVAAGWHYHEMRVEYQRRAIRLVLDAELPRSMVEHHERSACVEQENAERLRSSVADSSSQVVGNHVRARARLSERYAEYHRKKAAEWRPLEAYFRAEMRKLNRAADYPWLPLAPPGTPPPQPDDDAGIPLVPEEPEDG